MGSFAWPIAIVALGVLFMWIFRVQIGRLLDRTKSIGRGGLHAYDEGQQATIKPDAIAQFLEGYHSPLLLELEADIDEEATKRGLINSPDLIKALRKSLAGVVISLEFERTENTIFASQVAALVHLNGRAPTPSPLADVERFYSSAAEQYAKFYEKVDFGRWYGYLKARGLIREDPGGVTITVRAREYLKWRVDEGRSGPHYF